MNNNIIDLPYIGELKIQNINKSDNTFITKYIKKDKDNTYSIILMTKKEDKYLQPNINSISNSNLNDLNPTI